MSEADSPLGTMPAGRGGPFVGFSDMKTIGTAPKNAFFTRMIFIILLSHYLRNLVLLKFKPDGIAKTLQPK
jgi:hypothetical protein